MNVVGEGVPFSSYEWQKDDGHVYSLSPKDMFISEGKCRKCTSNMSQVRFKDGMLYYCFPCGYHFFHTFEPRLI